MAARARHAMNEHFEPLNSSGGTRHYDDKATDGECTYAIFTHLSLLAVLVIGLPVVASLAMWLIRRHDSPFLDDHGKEAVNFQISLVIYALLSTLLIPLCGVGAFLWIGVSALGIIGMILGAVAAYRGEYFRYPACLRLVK